MLVLVSFGLVLLATILLVVGLLNDDGLTLIYFSIASSFTAAVVLFLAFRRARPQAEPSAEAPAPLDDLEQPQAEAEPTAVTPAVAPAAATAAAAAPSPAPAAEEEVAEDDEDLEVDVAPAAADDWTVDDDWADEDEGWADEGGELEFPIADYDELTVAEILPLLPQLYSDELPVVLERERAGKNRSTITSRLEELAVTGTEADAAEAAEAGATETVAEPAAPPAPAPVALADDDLDDDLFPIADYDELTVAQIMPLLPQLELDELEDVKVREVAGQARKSLITEIDRYLSGELEPAAWDDEAGEPVPAAAPPAPAPAPAGLPIAGYDDLTVAQIRPRLTELSDGDLEAVRAHEEANAGRKTILADIERRLGDAGAAPTAPAPRKAAATKATARKAAKKATKKRAAKKATKAKKASAPRFPIAKYDELTVAEIRPRLSDLSDGQLQQVRERELAGAGRKTILKDIDAKLS